MRVLVSGGRKSTSNQFTFVPDALGAFLGSSWSSLGPPPRALPEPSKGRARVPGRLHENPNKAHPPSEHPQHIYCVAGALGAFLGSSWSYLGAPWSHLVFFSRGSPRALRGPRESSKRVGRGPHVVTHAVTHLAACDRLIGLPMLKNASKNNVVMEGSFE